MARLRNVREIVAACCLLAACAQGTEIEGPAGQGGGGGGTGGAGGAGTGGGGGAAGAGGEPCSPTTWYQDGDGDGVGNDAVTLVECAQPAGYVAQAGDCDDGSATTKPGGADVCNGVDDDCEGGADEGACGAGCTGVLDAMSGRSYAFCSPSLEWQEASAACASMGMRLVRLDDGAERTWVRDQATAAGLGAAWIGASDLVAEGQWIWEDGEQFWSGDEGGAPVGGLFAGWAGGEPNDDGTEDCAQMVASGAWNDAECGNGAASVCELY